MADYYDTLAKKPPTGHAEALRDLCRSADCTCRDYNLNKIIIDGYNLIHSIPALRDELKKSLENGREALLKKLQSYLAVKTVDITVVFDGSEPPPGIEPPHYGASLSVRFSRSPFKADPLIKEMIRRASSKKSVTLVSKDADIVRYARGHKAQVLQPDAFYNRISTAVDTKQVSETPDEMDDDELREWLRLFGEDGESDKPG